MSSISFERYDEEFLSLTEQVQKSLTSLDIESAQSSSSAESDLKFALNLLSQCEDLLKQMSVEARGADNADTKKELLHKVRVCKAKLANLRDDYETAKNEIERMSLISPSLGPSRGNGAGSHKERLLATSEKIKSQNDTLERARRIMADTEETAMEITTELGRNRETIQSAHGRVREVSGLTNRARRIVQNMSRREVQQKLVLYMVLAVIFIVLVIIIFNL
uniref:Vesicle transport v-SNARE N-terminal domain-containing protein n=1 Tax=Ditylum brightwellii TaxID=49249 RepID=A0A6S8XXA7_9STRA